MSALTAGVQAMYDFVRETKLKPETIFFLQSGPTENVSNIHK